MKLTKQTLKKLIQETYQSDIARRAARIDPRLVAKGEPLLTSIEPAIVNQLTAGLNKVLQEMKKNLGDEETLAELIDMAEDEIQNFRSEYDMDAPEARVQYTLPTPSGPGRRARGRSQY